MPSKPVSKKSVKKRYQRRKKNPLYRPIAPMGQSIGFPKERTVRLRYCQSVELSSTTGVLTAHWFRANSLFDPDYSGTGHQPLLFDQYALMYNHYQVLGSKIQVTMTPVGNESTPHACGIYLADDVSIYTTWDGMQESGRAKVKTIQLSQNPVNLVSTFGLRKFFTKSVDNGNTSSPVTTNPSEQAFFAVWIQPFDITSTSSYPIQCKVQIDYIARFFEPKDIAQS